jgi:hypothetical protein
MFASFGVFHLAQMLIPDLLGVFFHYISSVTIVSHPEKNMDFDAWNLHSENLSR